MRLLSQSEAAWNHCDCCPSPRQYETIATAVPDRGSMKPLRLLSQFEAVWNHCDCCPSPRQHETIAGSIWHTAYISAAKGGAPNYSAHQLPISVAQTVVLLFKSYQLKVFAMSRVSLCRKTHRPCVCAILSDFLGAQYKTMTDLYRKNTVDCIKFCSYINMNIH